TILIYFTDGTLRTYDTAQKMSHEWEELLAKIMVSSIAWSSNKKYVVQSGYDYISLYDTAHHKKLLFIDNLSDLCDQLQAKSKPMALIADLNPMIPRSNPLSILWDKKIIEKKNEPLIARHLVWSKNNKFLACALRDNRATIYSHKLFIVNTQF